MSVSFTYASLQSAITSWVEDTDLDFTANLDTIIGLGELKLLRDLDLELFEQQATTPTSNGVATLTKPANYLTHRTLHYTDSNSTLQYLQPRTFEYVIDYGGTGDPRYFAELNETQWQLAPVPTSTLTVNVRYTTRPVGLSASMTTTWLSTNAADALLYSCLICAEEFLKSDERLPVWKAKYEQEILPRAKHELQKLVKADYNLPG